MERRSLYRTLLWTVALLAAVLLIFGNRGFALQAISQILAVGIAAMGFNLLLGIAGQISIGHAAFMAIGAYTTAIFSLRFGVPFPLTLVPIVVIAALLGLVIGLPALRLKGYYLAIATLAFGVVVEQLIAGSRALGGYDGIRNIPPFFGGDRGTIITTTVVYVVMAVLTSAILASPLGRRLRMVRDSVQAARSYGVDVARAKLTAFVLSAVYGGIGGAMYAHTVGFIVPTSFSLVLSLNLLAAVIIGGIATIHGGLIGSALIVGLPFIFSRSVGAFLNIVVGALLIVFVLFFPRGIFYGLTIAYHRYLQRPFIAVRNLRTRRRSRDGHSVTVDGVTMFFREVDNTATGGAVGSAEGNGTGGAIGSAGGKRHGRHDADRARGHGRHHDGRYGPGRSDHAATGSVPSWEHRQQPVVRPRHGPARPTMHRRGYAQLRPFRRDRCGGDRPVRRVRGGVHPHQGTGWSGPGGPLPGGRRGARRGVETSGMRRKPGTGRPGAAGWFGHAGGALCGDPVLPHQSGAVAPRHRGGDTGTLGGTSSRPSLPRSPHR